MGSENALGVLNEGAKSPVSAPRNHVAMRTASHCAVRNSVTQSDTQSAAQSATHTWSCARSGRVDAGSKDCRSRVAVRAGVKKLGVEEKEDEKDDDVDVAGKVEAEEEEGG